MPHAYVEPVASYVEGDAIAAFVERAFETGAAARVLSGPAAPDRLVVVKPNWIEQSHQHDPEVWEPVITHPAVILATLECLAARMQGVGTIALCDAPHTYADFTAIGPGTGAAIGAGIGDRRMVVLSASVAKVEVVLRVGVERREVGRSGEKRHEAGIGADRRVGADVV